MERNDKFHGIHEIWWTAESRDLKVGHRALNVNNASWSESACPCLAWRDKMAQLMTTIKTNLLQYNTSTEKSFLAENQ